MAIRNEPGLRSYNPLLTSNRGIERPGQWLLQLNPTLATAPIDHLPDLAFLYPQISGLNPEGLVPNLRMKVLRQRIWRNYCFCNAGMASVLQSPHNHRVKPIPNPGLGKEWPREGLDWRPEGGPYQLRRLIKRCQ